MKTLRMIAAVLGLSLSVGSSVHAIRAGAGARAGLPDLYKQLKLDKDASGTVVAQAVIAKLTDTIAKGDANNTRKFSDSYRVFLQKRPLHQNLGVDGTDKNDPEELGGGLRTLVTKVDGFFRNAREAVEDEDINKADLKKAENALKATKTVIAITGKEIERQAKRWFDSHKGDQKAFLRALGQSQFRELSFTTNPEDQSQDLNVNEEEDVLNIDLGFDEEQQRLINLQTADIDVPFVRGNVSDGETYYQFVVAKYAKGAQASNQGFFSNLFSKKTSSVDPVSIEYAPSTKESPVTNLQNAQEAALEMTTENEDYVFRVIAVHAVKRNDSGDDGILEEYTPEGWAIFVETSLAEQDEDDV